MNRIFFLLGMLSFLFTTQSAYANVYQLELKNIEPNTYISREGYIITTRNCTANPSQFEDVVLIYPAENYISKHTLIFTQSKTAQICNIKSIQKGSSFPAILDN